MVALAEEPASGSPLARVKVGKVSIARASIAVAAPSPGIRIFIETSAINFILTSHRLNPTARRDSHRRILLLSSCDKVKSFFFGFQEVHSVVKCRILSNGRRGGRVSL